MKVRQLAARAALLGLAVGLGLVAVRAAVRRGRRPAPVPPVSPREAEPLDETFANSPEPVIEEDPHAGR